MLSLAQPGPPAGLNRACNIRKSRLEAYNCANNTGSGAVSEGFGSGEMSGTGKFSTPETYYQKGNLNIDLNNKLIMVILMAMG